MSAFGKTVKQISLALLSFIWEALWFLKQISLRAMFHFKATSKILNAINFSMKVALKMKERGREFEWSDGASIL